jgi:anaerobic selenocysteine-containing dehydrogenase
MKDPVIRAVWVTAGNPVAMLPESETTRRALQSREFVVVVDAFLTDTARVAHLVLPTTTLLEADDLLGSYGHHWIGAATPVVPPPEGVKSDLEIIQALAKRVGLEPIMAGDPREWKRRMMQPKLGPHQITLERLEAGSIRNPIPPKVLFAERKFPTKTGRMNLLTEAPPIEVPAPDYPLFLMSLSTEKAQSSQWAIQEKGPTTVAVHPDAAQGIKDGELCRLESRVSSITVRLRHDSKQRRDVALVPKGGHLREGRCANVLLRARTTDLGEGGALYDEHVRLVPLEPGIPTR